MYYSAFKLLRHNLSHTSYATHFF